MLVGASVSYDNAPGVAWEPRRIEIGTTVITSYTAQGLSVLEARSKSAAFKKEVGEALTAAGYPARADMSQVNTLKVIALLSYLVILK